MRFATIRSIFLLMCLIYVWWHFYCMVANCSIRGIRKWVPRGIRCAMSSSFSKYNIFMIIRMMILWVAFSMWRDVLSASKWKQFVPKEWTYTIRWPPKMFLGQVFVNFMKDRSKISQQGVALQWNFLDLFELWLCN